MKPDIPFVVKIVLDVFVVAFAIVMIWGSIEGAHAASPTYSVIECEFEGVNAAGVPGVFCGVIPIATHLPTASACRAKAKALHDAMRGEGAVNVSFQCVQEPWR